MIYSTVVFAALASLAAGELSFENDPQLKAKFEAFKVEFKKSYDTMVEEENRFLIFAENLKVAEARNTLERQSGGTAEHGVTKFSDMTQTEFEANFLTANPTMRNKNRTYGTAPSAVGLGSTKDWSGVLTTPVKDQGYCGSCWAFSATEQIESDLMRTQGTTYLLSPEQIVQCDSTSYGCDGGWTEHAYDYVKRAGGLELDSDYPYTSYQGVTGTCKSDSSKYKVAVSGYTTLSGESAMANYVLSTGPLSVCLDAASWNTYKGGIMSSCGKRVDHCVQAVGVDTTSYWKVRNSWGTSWGEGGYIRLSYGSNTCAITSDPTYATVSLK